MCVAWGHFVRERILAAVTTIGDVVYKTSGLSRIFRNAGAAKITLHSIRGKVYGYGRRGIGCRVSEDIWIRRRSFGSIARQRQGGDTESINKILDACLKCLIYCVSIGISYLIVCAVKQIAASCKRAISVCSSASNIYSKSRAILEQKGYASWSTIRRATSVKGKVVPALIVRRTVRFKIPCNLIYRTLRDWWRDLNCLRVTNKRETTVLLIERPAAASPATTRIRPRKPVLATPSIDDSPKIVVVRECVLESQTDTRLRDDWNVQMDVQRIDRHFVVLSFKRLDANSPRKLSKTLARECKESQNQPE